MKLVNDDGAIFLCFVTKLLYMRTKIIQNKIPKIGKWEKNVESISVELRINWPEDIENGNPRGQLNRHKNERNTVKWIESNRKKICLSPLPPPPISKKVQIEPKIENKN